MIFGRTIHATSPDGKETHSTVRAWNLRPGVSYETTDGATYRVTALGAVVRVGKVKGTKREKRKARRAQRAAAAAAATAEVVE